MATTPEIKTRFTLEGMRQAAAGMKAFGRTVADTLGDARRRGGKVFDPLDRSLKGVEDRAKSASKAILAIGGRGAFNGLRTSALGAGIAVGGLTTKISAVSAAAIKAAKDSAASLKAISIDAQRIGGSTSDVAVLGYAADITGTDRDELITQISTLSNEFLTLRENIWKAENTYGDFLFGLKQQTKLAGLMAGKSGVSQVMTGFADAQLEARKASITDAENRIAAIDAEMNTIRAKPLYTTQRTRVLDSARQMSMQYERRELIKAIEEFRASQSTQGQGLYELMDYGLDFDEATRGGVEGLLAISEAFQNVENPSQKARIAMRLFGEDAGVKLVPLLNGGRHAIEEYRKTVESSGAIATQQDIETAEDYARAIQNLKTATSGVQLTIGRALTPDLTKASQELTAWLIRSREEIAKVAVEAFKDTRVFAEDAMTLFSGDTDNIQTGWLDTVVQKTLGLRAVWADVRKQVTLLWEGKDSDYKWLNTLRDGFVEVRKFAMDVWAVVSGGNAGDFKWLNTARDQVVAFATRLQDAFGMLKDLVASLADFFKPVLDYIGKDIMTVGLFLGLTRMVGLFSVLTTGAGLLFKALGGVFALAGGAAAAVGAVGGAAGGAAGAAGAAVATAGGLRVALAGVGAAIGGLTSAAVLLGTTLVGAFALGQMAAAKLTEGTRGAYEEVWKQQAKLIQAQDAGHINALMKDRTDSTVKFRERYWASQGVKIDGRTTAERNLDNAQNSDIRIWGSARYTGGDAAARYQEEEELQRWRDERYKSAELMSVTKRVAVDLNVAGKTRTVTADEPTAALLLRDLEVATRGY